MNSVNNRLALLVLVASCATLAKAQPVGNWYGTMTNFNGDRIAKVSGGTLTFATAGHPYEGAIAVDGDVRTINYYPSGQGARYDLALNNLGTNYSFTAAGRFADGASDAAHNYTIDTLSGDVYQLDRNWQNASMLFSLGTPVQGGITYNSANGALIIAGNSTGSLGQYMLDGTQISSFTVPAYVENLAYDLDGTLWIHNNNTLSHYSVVGSNLPGSMTASLSGDFCHGGEIGAVPEPVSLVAISSGIVGLAVRRRRLRR